MGHFTRDRMSEEQTRLEESEESDDEDFVPEEQPEDTQTESKEQEDTSTFSLIAQKRTRDKVASIWAEMNNSPSKKAKPTLPVPTTPSPTPAPSGSRFSFAASPSTLLQQAKKAQEAILEKPESTQTSTRVYDFAGEKVSVPTGEETKPQQRGNLDDLIDSLQKRKMSSLQKSKLDWDKYKKDNKIEEDLE